MRIDAYNQIGQIYRTEQKTRTKSIDKKTGKDELQLSSAGKDYQTARQAVSQVSDIREDRVAYLKAQIEKGTYAVSTDSFAEKLIAKYHEMR